MIFVPLTADRLGDLLGAGELGASDAFTATAALRDDLGLGPREDEDADFAAFRYASVRAVSTVAEDTAAARPGRIVIAADVSAGDVSEAANDRLGRVTAARVRLRDVTAVYLDEEAAAPAVAAARTVLEGSNDLGEVMEAPEVLSLLDEHAMLWHLPDEVAD